MNKKLWNKNHVIKQIQQELNKIYKEIPSFECKKGCQECCGPVRWSLAEDIVIRDYMKKHDVKYIKWSWQDYKRNKFLCPYIQNNTCIIYPVRPLLCRLFGHIEQLRCPYITNIEQLDKDKSVELNKRLIQLDKTLLRKRIIKRER